MHVPKVSISLQRFPRVQLSPTEEQYWDTMGWGDWTETPAAIIGSSRHVFVNTSPRSCQEMARHEVLV